jgi:bisphosphoglycerate-dependent phosphoglycerate mutase
VAALEERLTATQNTLRALVKKLEEIHKMDIDQDGRVG